MTPERYPELRTIDTRPVVHNGRRSILLRDPLQLSDHTIVVPQQLAPLLLLCDGTRDSDELRATLTVRFGLRLDRSTLEQFLTALDEACLLKNERSARARERALQAYRRAPFREPALAGRSYPSDPDTLRRRLASDVEAADAAPGADHWRGLVTPHIDYDRGGAVYAAVWQRAAEAARAAELMVVLGTDHFGGDGQLTLTRQDYATPFGPLPTAQDVVDGLTQTLDEETLFADELHHRSEHSIELAAVWLHYVRDGEPCPLLPILCGSFGHFIQRGISPANDPIVEALVDALRAVMDERRTLVVAAGDLAHVGPAFGGQPQGLAQRARLQAADDALLRAMQAGDAEGVYAAIARDDDRFNVCGLPPIYLALRLLAPSVGERVAYERCPADEQGTSFVSVCGMTFR